VCLCVCVSVSVCPMVCVCVCVCVSIVNSHAGNLNIYPKLRHTYLRTHAHTRKWIHKMDTYKQTQQLLFWFIWCWDTSFLLLFGSDPEASSDTSSQGVSKQNFPNRHHPKLPNTQANQPTHSFLTNRCDFHLRIFRGKKTFLGSL
jgi:hypothetical protein